MTALQVGGLAAFAQTSPAAGTENPPAKKVSASSPSNPDEPAVVQLDKVNVVESNSGADAAFADKSGSDTSKEVLTGAVLKTPTANSVSDLLKNAAGVTVSISADGASKISIRGLDSRFIRVTVDGQRQGGGSNALDSLPPEIVQSLEVTKALTPDQDGDAIGGAINVTTAMTDFKHIRAQGREQLTFNTTEPRPGIRNNASISAPFSLFSPSANAGILFSVTYDDQYRLREQYRSLRQWTPLLAPSGTPSAGLLVPVLTQPFIESTQEHRKRSSLVFNADAHWGKTTLFWRANLNRDWTNRDRRFDDFDPSLGTPVALASNRATLSGVFQDRRNQRQVNQRDAANFSLGGRTSLGPLDLDASIGAALTEEKEPHTLDTVFRSASSFLTSYDLSTELALPRFTFVDESDPANATSINNPARYLFNSLNVQKSDVRDRELALNFNAKLNLGDKAQGDFFKFGGKIQERHRTANTDRDVYNAGSVARALTGLVALDQVSVPIAGYRFGPTPNADAVASLLTASPALFQLDDVETRVSSATTDYTATETIWAGYGMARLKRGRWTLVGGARVEGTRVKTLGNEVAFDASGRLQSILPVRATRSYWDLLPGLHARYDLRHGLLIRSSLTRSLARPSYSELVPQKQLYFIERRVRTGNPDLKPYQATNFDLSVDNYSERLGLLSVGLFFKKIDHFVADAQNNVTLGELGTFSEFKRINGDSAKVAGTEISWQSITYELPAGLGKSSIQANYTLINSVTQFPGRPGETFPLVDQVKHQAGITVRDERGPLALEATLRYRTKMLEDIIAPGFDNYRKPFFDAELSLVYKIRKNLRISLGVANLINAPTHNYSEDLSRVNEYQHNGIDLNLGAQWKY